MMTKVLRVWDIYFAAHNKNLRTLAAIRAIKKKRKTKSEFEPN